MRQISDVQQLQLFNRYLQEPLQACSMLYIMKDGHTASHWEHSALLPRYQHCYTCVLICSVSSPECKNTLKSHLCPPAMTNSPSNIHRATKDFLHEFRLWDYCFTCFFWQIPRKQWHISQNLPGECVLILLHELKPKDFNIGWDLVFLV